MYTTLATCLYSFINTLCPNVPLRIHKIGQENLKMYKDV